MTKSFLIMALVLGLISAVGPFSIDMYLPALPSMGASLGASPSAVQMSLIASFITIGICQLLYGPLSDIVGRKPPIYWGLTIFAAGSIGCALAPTIEVLIFFRVLQAFGACAGMVIPRAIVRDMYTGHDATRLMSLLMLVVSISPILAPITGSFIIAAVGWRGVFLVLTVAAVIALALAVTSLEETRVPDVRRENFWRGTFKAYGRLLLDFEFIGLTLAGAMGLSAFFVYLGSAPYVLINIYGLTPAGFSLCFALNAASFFGFTQFTGYLTRRYGLPPVIKIAVGGFALTMTLMGVLVACGIETLYVLMPFLMIGYGFLGLVIPTTTVLSLEQQGAIAGTASALLGTLQMVVGAAIMALTTAFLSGSARPMFYGIAICAVASFVIAQFALRKVKLVPLSAEAG